MDRIVFEEVEHKFALPTNPDGSRQVELRAFTHGLMPRSVPEALMQFTHDWQSEGVDAWVHAPAASQLFAVPETGQTEPVNWWMLPEVLGDRFIARLLNAPQGTCIMMPNASATMQQILSCVELNRPGKRGVIRTTAEFPAVTHPLAHANRRLQQYSPATREEASFQTTVVDMSGPFDPEKIIAEITDETALVVFSHVGFLTGELVSNEAIREIVNTAHDYGALVAVDGYHAVGCTEIDVQAMGVDLYFGGLLKEACGSSGNGFLYVREGLELGGEDAEERKVAATGLTPTGSGWVADEEPFDFLPEPIPNKRVRRRFLAGTPNIASLYHGAEGLKVLFGVGMNRVVNDIRSKVGSIVNRLSTEGMNISSPHEESRRSGMVILEVPEAKKLCTYLKSRGVMTDSRINRYLRLSPHVYNAPEDIERAVDEIIEAIRSGEYLKIELEENRGSPVT